MIELEITDEGRTCGWCYEFKSWSEYHKNRHSETGYHSRCKICRGHIRKAKQSGQKPIGKNPNGYYNRDYIVSDEGRTCTACEIFKSWGEFGENKNRKRGHSSRCRECEKERLVRYKYGINKEQYQELLSNPHCAICGKEQGNDKNSLLCVDHCHKTGKVRGLLCHSCNTLLGRCNDSVEILKQAICYLERNAVTE